MLSYTYAEKQIKRGNHCEKSKAVLLAAAIPTVLLIAVILLVIFGVKYLNGFNEAQLDIKQDNFTSANATSLTGQTVFLGDSITEYYPVAESYGSFTQKTGSLVYNRGISAETSGHMKDRLNDTVIPLRPRNVVMLIGTNDIGQGVPEEELLKNITDSVKMIREQSPETNLIVQAIYPVNEHMETLYARVMVGKRTNAGITAINEKIKTIAQENGAVFLDLTKELSDENGDLKRAFTYDGLHPTAEGYAVITEKFCLCLSNYSFKIASTISSAPLNQERSKDNFCAARLPIFPPKRTASIPTAKENSITINTFTCISAAPKPTASPSRDNATASEAASAGESTREPSRSAFSGSA